MEARNHPQPPTTLPGRANEVTKVALLQLTMAEQQCRFGSFASIWPTRATSAIHPIATE